MQFASGYAIDLVMIPAKDVQEFAIRMNRALIASSGDRSIVLGSGRCIPHISLSMGAVSRENIDYISEALRECVQIHLPQEVYITGTTTVTTGSGTRVTGLDIALTPALLRLHEKCMTIIRDYGETVTSDMLLREDHGPVDEYIVNYIRNYPVHSAYSNFSPHITLGHGDKGKIRIDVEFPLPLRCESLAVCHMGNHGVCGRILLRI